MSTPPFIRPRRTQPRYGLEHPAQLIAPGVQAPTLALLQDLSWGGACLILPRPPSTPLGTLLIRLPGTPPPPMIAQAQCLRTRALDDGRVRLAVRFSRLTLAHHVRLLQRLNSLAPHPEAGEYRFAATLEVVVNEAAEFHQRLSEIASGRLTLTVFRAYEVGQCLGFTLAETQAAEAGERAHQELRARVVEVQPMGTPDDDGVTLFRTTLAFEHPVSSLKTYVTRQLERALRTRRLNAARAPFERAARPSGGQAG